MPCGSRKCQPENVSPVTLPGNKKYLRILRFIPSRDVVVSVESILIKKQKRRMNLIKDIRIFFPFAGSAP